MNSSSLTFSDLQIEKTFSCNFDTALCGIDQNWRKIEFLHVSLDQKGQPLITKRSRGGLSYRVSECNLDMIPNFRTLLEKNLILLHTDKMEMMAFLGFEKYGKISKHSQFCGGKISHRADSYTFANIGSNGTHQTTVNYESDKISLASFKLMDHKTSEHVKKTLMDIAWWFDKVPNETSKKQYELINHLPSNQIYKAAQPIFNKPTISSPIASQNKIISSIPTNIISSSIINVPTKSNFSSSSIDSKIPISSFLSFTDFQGNNFEKDSKIPPSAILKQALVLANKEGYTNFSIKNSFDENETVHLENYKHSITGDTCHQAKVNFYITASTTSGKSIKLVLQREFYAFHSIEKVALKAIIETCETVMKDAAI